jgi:GntR family transcriptional regulator, arabinose operon transcriptional repressor
MLVPEAFPHMGESDVKYQRVQDSLRKRIFTGELEAGAMLPPERELMLDYKVSRQTIRGALATLEEEGIIVRRQGVGTLVGFPSIERNPPSKEIGVITSGLDENYTMPLVKAVSAGAAREGYSMNLSDCPDGFGTNMENVLAMLKRNVAGLLIFPLITHVQNQTYRFLNGTGMPFVFVDSLVQYVEADCVTTENFQGAYDGTKALIDSGCRRIAYIGISMAAWTSRERLSGFQKAIWDAGLEVDRSLILEGYYERAHIEAALGKALNAKPAIDAIFFANHPLTEIAFAMMDEKNFPGQSNLKFCSFDAPAPPELFKGKVISVRQPGTAIGETAIKLLLERMEERRSGKAPSPARHIQIPPTVIRI